MFRRQNQQSVTAQVQEVKATQEGVEDNCGEVTEKVMEQGRKEKVREEQKTLTKGPVGGERGAVAALKCLTNRDA